MKIVAYSRIPGETIPQPLPVDIIPDSAIVPYNRPVFLPDFTRSWAADICPAYRISRLGKGITPKFAPRYYDAVTLALRLIPTQILQQLHNRMQPTGVAGVFDNCLPLGQWIPLTDTPPDLHIQAPGIDLQLTHRHCDIDHTLAAISEIATLKTGDIILPCRLPLATVMTPDTDFTIELNGTPVLPIRLR